MDDQAEVMVIIFSSLTAIVTGYQIFRVARAWRQVRQDLVPPEVREQSHAVKNEAMVVRAGLRDVARSDDPLGELARRIRVAKWRRHERIK